MNEIVLQKVALRHRAIFLPVEEDAGKYAPTAEAMAFVARLKSNGYTVSEPLLHALNKASEKTLNDITKVINEVYRADFNWMPLVKGWDVPTGETRTDHLITFLANLFGGEAAGFKGTTLPCGHFIPEGTFPLERYNGCPYCGTAFHTTDYVFHGQGSKLKELQLYTLDDLKQKVYYPLLASSTPLDATQLDTLKLLLGEFEVPEDIDITMKETVMVVVREAGHETIDLKIELGKRYFKTPTDVLRYFWYEKTGQVKIIEPKHLVSMAAKAGRHHFLPADQREKFADEKRQELKLSYNRRDCRMAAIWLNAVPMTAQQAAENMNPKREMWARYIHALRLGEYSRKKGFERLAALLDVFYKQDYETWMGQLDKAQKDNQVGRVLQQLSTRPGMFARCLFSTMLRLGKDVTLEAFDKVSDQLPSRLLLSLGNAADSWFDADQTRLARPITGGVHPVQPHPLLFDYDKSQRLAMAQAVNDLFGKAMRRRFAKKPTQAKTIYIDPRLYEVPVSVGDRTTTIQDTSCALMGTRFPVEGDAVRLFMHWGKGLPAQHLDMDLSCAIALDNGPSVECAYYNLTAPGAKHSGDIIHIPEQVGAAEYIELNLPELEHAGARYVSFTCNAYSNGSISPNLMVGWMNSAYPMTISDTTGVAYDPSTVQHVVRISESNLSKGMVFGILDVKKREIVWLEMPFDGQTVRDLDLATVEALLRRLQNKLSIGQLLELKRDAQNLTQTQNIDQADEAYTYQWALNPTLVATLLI
ncbi:MAG: hypothetical protein K6A28_06700 [Bacteroidales bacterium]|nr:hypothetical protein [Bacteroidales bacterium]